MILKILVTIGAVFSGIGMMMGLMAHDTNLILVNGVVYLSSIILIKGE